jgi:hypothetical protein
LTIAHSLNIKVDLEHLSLWREIQREDYLIDFGDFFGD